MLRAASIGLGWWSDELAGAVQGKSDKIEIVSCFSRSADKRAAFAEKFSAVSMTATRPCSPIPRSTR